MIKKLFIILIGFALISNIGIYFYYENQIEAQESFNTYTVVLSSNSDTKPIEEIENQKGCVMLFNDIDKTTNTRTLTFTCDPIPVDETPDFEQRLRELEQRVSILEGRAIIP